MNETIASHHEQGPGRQFDRERSYEAAAQEVLQLLRVEMQLAGESADLHQAIMHLMETIAPQSENFRKLEVLAEMRTLVELDRVRYEKAGRYQQAAQLVDALYQEKAAA